VTYWPFFGWAWPVAVAAAVLAMIAYGLTPQRGPLKLRITVAMVVFVVAYFVVLTVLTYYGIGV
jgi:type IV secretory pathway VirB2 component (pilin)